MTSSRRWVGILAVLALAINTLDAQSLDSIRTGEQVKVWSRATGTEGVKATWMRVVDDSVVLTVGKTKRELRIPVDSLWRLDVRRGNSKPRGAILGAIPGAVTGGLTGWLLSTGSALVFKDCSDCQYGPIPSEKERWEQEDRDMARKSAVIGAGLGAVAGAWWGSRRLAPQWKRLPVGKRIGEFRMMPSADGTRLLFSLSGSFQ